MNLETQLKSRVPLNNKWAVLQDLWTQCQFLSVNFERTDYGFYLKEVIDNEIVYQLRRDYVSNRRYTDKDVYGLLGVSLLNLQDKQVIITEGVSDFITVKICNPTCNVLGVTNLGGSTNAKKILVSLFESVTIIMDNDPTGITNGMKWRTFLNSYGISTDLYLPEQPAKDVTDEFLLNLKMNQINGSFS